MEQPPTIQLRPWHLIANGLGDLFRPPLALLLLIDLLIFGALTSVSDQVDDASFFGAILLTVVSAFVQIALTMAAASDEQGSADEWVKLAFKRGVFWRFILTGIVTIAAVFVGLLAFIIGGLVLGGMLGLAQTVAIQERAWPGMAIRKSIALSQGHRMPIGSIFAITFILPNALMQAGAQLRWDRDLGLAWDALGAAATVLTLVGVVALARAYVALGGKTTAIAPASSRSLR
ncbi:MAG: hypothetical protein ACRDJT_12200 [Actinomycetota bacterium]